MTSLRTITRDELNKHNTAKSCWVTMDSTDRVYDVTEFLDDHPGGGELILEYAGKDIRGPMEDPVSHSHSDGAFDILEEYCIGVLPTAHKAVPSEVADGKLQTMEESEHAREVFELTGLSCAADLSKDTDYDLDHKTHKFIDLNKPMLMQVWRGGFSKQFYLEQVHRPRHYKGGASAPLFGNFLEPLSKTPWYVIPIVWLPCIAFGTYTAWSHIGTLATLQCFPLGLAIWTLVEYAMHRFLFHVDEYMPDHPAACTLHFLLHGVHHYLPMDRLRLVMPPTLFLILATPFWRLALALFPRYYAMAIFSGGILGYVIYDLTHYFLHHKNLPSLWKELKSYHLAHHYQNYELGYGVSSKFWDKVFGTTLILAKAD
ncbi:fatty acid alpha-hydroxylase [Savitreella phatthalungensis]